MECVLIKSKKNGSEEGGSWFVFNGSKVNIIVNNQKQSTNLFQVSLISVHLVFAHLRTKIEVTSSDPVII